MSENLESVRPRDGRERDARRLRHASAVGAETDTIAGAPIAAAFCTISTETRLVRSTIPSFAAMDARARVPESLSSAL